MSPALFRAWFSFIAVVILGAPPSLCLLVTQACELLHSAQAHQWLYYHHLPPACLLPPAGSLGAVMCLLRICPPPFLLVRLLG